MTVELSLTSPFWEDEASLFVAGEDAQAVLRICVRALQAADYDVQLRDADGTLTPYEEPDDEEDE